VLRTTNQQKQNEIAQAKQDSKKQITVPTTTIIIIIIIIITATKSYQVFLMPVILLSYSN